MSPPNSEAAGDARACDGSAAFGLERWSDVHREAFVRMHEDPAVMRDLGGPFARAAGDETFDRYRNAWTSDGISRWTVVDPAGRFLGCAGVMRRGDPEHPLGPHHEIGWRFRRDAWGRGLATASARRALAHAWTVLEVREILSYTAVDNARSQAMMHGLGLGARSDP